MGGCLVESAHVGSPRVLTHLGRVLRCFEWFSDLVDPWWMRNRMSISIWMHRFRLPGQKLYKPWSSGNGNVATHTPLPSQLLPGVLCAARGPCFSARGRRWERKWEWLGQGKEPVWTWGGAGRAESTPWGQDSSPQQALGNSNHEGL